VDQHERQKAYPARFPANSDSIGIENVGRALKDSIHKEAQFEILTLAEQSSLTWLIGELVTALHLTRDYIFRHPQLSRKNTTEAASAKF